jgi:hypothetical protein
MNMYTYIKNAYKRVKQAIVDLDKHLLFLKGEDRYLNIYTYACTKLVYTHNY